MQHTSGPSPVVIAVIGASGYVGARLVGRLRAGRDRLILCGRNAAALASRWPGAEVRTLDLDEPTTVAPALAGVDLVYYLAHAMDGRGDFVEREALAARAVGEAAHQAGVDRIVYLGGLGDPEGELSAHLASRQRTGALLGAAGVPVTELRAAIVVGSGSASFEILRHLVERLPLMLTPRWVRTRCQPIGIDDVIAFLLAARDHPEVTGVVEIGGADVQTYGSMMMEYARARRLRRFMIPVPVLTPRLSSYWVHLVSPIPAGLAGPLIEGLRHEVVVRDPGPARRLGVVPMTYREALARALDRTGPDASAWFDAVRPPRSALTSTEGMYVDRRERLVPVSPQQAFQAVLRSGGTARWPNASPRWLLRGLFDSLGGGHRLLRGRQDPPDIHEGDVLGNWRVHRFQPGRLLRLTAEMRLPGRAWLQYEVTAAGEGTRLIQTVYFEPRGLAGMVYWYAAFPIQTVIFGAMLGVLVRRSGRA